MYIVFIGFVFFLLHIYFLLQYIFLDKRGAQFAEWFVAYPYSEAIAIRTLGYSLLSLLFFLIGYAASEYKLILKTKTNGNQIQVQVTHDINLAIRVAYVLFIFQILVFLYVIALNNGDYSKMVEMRESLNFLFELRVFPLLMLSFVCLNIPAKLWLSNPKLDALKLVLIVYIILVLFIQARSLVFEVLAIIGFCYLKWDQNKIRFRYLVIMILSLLGPNLIVLNRLKGTLDARKIFDILFSFEYSVLFTNMVSTAIYNNVYFWGKTFFPSLILMIPSPLRELLGVHVEKSDLYLILAHQAGVYGGGFSLLAELFMNYGWYSLILYFIVGYILGLYLRHILYAKFVNLYYASTPLLYIAFILAFRNDLGVFLKYIIQLQVEVLMLNYFFYHRFKIRL